MSATIFALASGSVPSAIAIIRISGPSASFAVRSMCNVPGRPFSVRLCKFVDPESQELIDNGLLAWFEAPKSFCGEDTAEFHLHGGRAVVLAVLRGLAKLPGLRPALPGEFTRKAFLNGKLDLTQVEGVADVVAAETQSQLTQALSLAGGALASQAKIWRQALLGLMASVAAEMDFADEGDVPSQLPSQFFVSIDELVAELQSVLSDGRRGEIIRDGYCVVIAGPPNVGKSSLLNYLLRRQASIVSATAGTTRDLIEVRLDIDGIPVILVDSAGIREGRDDVEYEGIRRAKKRAEEANLVLWVSELDSLVAPADIAVKTDVLIVGSKSDLGLPTLNNDVFAISTISGAGIPELVSEVTRRARVATDGSNPSLVAHERHRACLSLAAAALQSVFAHKDRIELMSDDLRACCHQLESLIGVVGVEDVLEQVFSRFCIGK